MLLRTFAPYFQLFRLVVVRTMSKSKRFSEHPTSFLVSCFIRAPASNRCSGAPRYVRLNPKRITDTSILLPFLLTFGRRRAFRPWNALPEMCRLISEIIARISVRNSLRTVCGSQGTFRNPPAVQPFHNCYGERDPPTNYLKSGSLIWVFRRRLGYVSWTVKIGHEEADQARTL